MPLGPPGAVLLITGSNMSGKSTLLRAIGANAVLAQSGAPVCAASLQMPPCECRPASGSRIRSSRRVVLHGGAGAPQGGRGRGGARASGEGALFYLLDEILQGTNSAERGIAVQAVARHLLDAGAIGAMTTHDLNLASEEPLRSHARTSSTSPRSSKHGEMSFDYRLRDGLATSRNAIRLMELIGIPPYRTPRPAELATTSGTPIAFHHSRME